MPWCKYCQEFNPIWDSFAKSESRVSLKKINMEKDNNQYLGKKYSVKSYPTLLLVKEDGNVVRFQEKRTETNLKEFVSANV